MHGSVFFCWSSFLNLVDAVHYSFRRCADRGNQIPTLNKLALNLRYPSVTVLPLEWPPSPQWHGCCFCLSTKTNTSYQSHSRCSGNSNGSECYPHGLTNKPPTSHYYCKKPWLPSILLTAVGEILFFQAFALKRILNSDFSWHCQFQENCLLCCHRQMSLSDLLFVTAISGGKFIICLRSVLIGQPVAVPSKPLLFTLALCFFSPSFTTLTHFRPTRFFPSFMTFPPRSQSTLLELYHVSKCTIHLSKPLYTWILYTYILNWLVYHRIRASDHLSDPMLQD